MFKMKLFKVFHFSGKNFLTRNDANNNDNSFRALCYFAKEKLGKYPSGKTLVFFQRTLIMINDDWIYIFIIILLSRKVSFCGSLFIFFSEV